jgi:cytochrome c553
MTSTRIIAAAAMVWLSAGIAPAAEVPPPGAASCSGCHPATRWSGSSVPRLIGVAPAQMLAAMQEFRSGSRASTVMDRIAKGFTDDEVRAIAAWYATQKD